MGHKAGILAALAWLAAGGAQAAELRIGMGEWSYGLAGTVTDHGQAYDFDRQLELKPSGRSSAMLEWDTPPGWWPDVQASYSRIGGSGSHTETTVVTIGGLPVSTVTHTMTTTSDFDDYDFTLRYPWQWSALRFTTGVTVMRLKGRLDITDTAQSQTVHETYDELVPELQVGVRWPLGSWLTLAATGQGVESGGNKAYEWHAGAELRVLHALLLEAGWQRKRYDIQVDDYALDATLGGALLRAGFVFR